MIEIAPEEYWKELTLPESIVYCFSLSIDGKIGWRLPTETEYVDRICSIGYTGWDQSDADDVYDTSDTLTCIPVRDLKDD